MNSFPSPPTEASSSPPAMPPRRTASCGRFSVFENACFERELLPDRDVHRMLERLTRTRVKLRQGRASIWVPAPVDFSDLSSEYIGILYEGLLDFELKTAPAGDPVIFLAVGNQPALPLSRLEAMDDRALADLLEKMKDTGRKDDEVEEDGEAAAADDNDDTVADDDDAAAAGEEEIPGGLFATAEEAAIGETIEEPGDERHATRTRAETWARRAVAVGKLVRRPRGALTPEKRARPRSGHRPEGPPARREGHPAGRVVRRPLGRHPQGIGHLLHPSRAGRPHGPADPTAPGLRSPDGAPMAAPIPTPRPPPGRRSLPRRSWPSRSATTGLRLRHLPRGGPALPHRFALCVARSTTTACSTATQVDPWQAILGHRRSATGDEKPSISAFSLAARRMTLSSRT